MDVDRGVKAAAPLLARAPRRARRLASELDLARSVGLAPVWRRRRHEARLEQVGRGFLDVVYGRIWREAAEELGARVSEADDGFLEIERGGARTRVRHHIVPLDDPAALRRALDKKAVHDALTGAGVPVPDHLEFDLGPLGAARRFVESSPSPCVVKPSSGTAGGAGVTSGVRTWPELWRAVLRASGYDTRMLVEGQGSGHVYRLLVLDGVLLDVVRRQPCGVTGDGRSTVGELIEQENRRRLTTPEAVPILPVDLDCVFTLARAGLSLR
ncbi:MAG: hypothetical protein M3N31_07655, partial [Actinomycetota bacterium]|nr:hypothetical protein [Actinomycetota bacterium]